MCTVCCADVTLDTGGVDPKKREAQFEILQVRPKRARSAYANWHHFLKALTLGGYRHEGMITSEAAVICSYVLYLIGLIDHGIDKAENAPSYRRSSFSWPRSPLPLYQLARNGIPNSISRSCAELKSGEVYLEKLRQICATTLTNDHWEIATS